MTASVADSPHRLCVAPMMDWTDRHDRYFLRLIAPRARLYTEMVTTGAILFGDKARFLRFDPAEHPVALQLGGADPEALASAAQEGQRFGYDEINLNVGCPSDRVQQGRFGACLMAEPALVAASVAAMRGAVDLPVTVKTRLGIDARDSYAFLTDFVGEVAEAGCEIFIIHARKAWLNGLSPKENREIPPLDYGRVHRLKRDFPKLTIILNGGLRDPDRLPAALANLDGVMIGREAYQNPYALALMQRVMFDDPAPLPSRREIVQRLLPHLDRQCLEGVPLHAMTRHILGLFNGQKGARAWRRHLSTAVHEAGAGVQTVEAALALVPEATERAAA